MRRQLAFQRRIIEIDVKIGQNCAGRLQLRDPVEGLIEMGMGRMGCIAQRIQDQQVEPLQVCQRRVRQAIDIITVRNVPYAKAQ